MSNSFPWRAALAAVALIGSLDVANAQANTWVVDAAGGAGSHFTDLQTAVSLAGEGDLIVIREGNYFGFTLTDKALSIFGVGDVQVRANDVTSFAPIRVEGLSAAKSVVIRNVDVVPPFPVVGEQSVVRVLDCAGPVLFEDCVLHAQSGPGVVALNSASVTLARCDVQSAPVGFTDISSGSASWAAHAGVRSVDSDVYLFETAVAGSYGGDAQNQFFFQRPPGTGGDAVELLGGSLFASGSALHGGDGGDDALGSVCFPAGNGGNGLRLQSGGGAPLARLLGTQLSPGDGGVSDCIDPDGLPGNETAVEAGTIEAIAGSARAFEWTSLALQGQGVQARYTGDAGDFVWLLLALDLGPDVLLNGYPAALLIDPSFLVVPLGTLPQSGELVHDYAGIGIGPFTHFPLDAQAAFLDTSFGFWVSGPSSLEIVAADPGL